MEANPNNNHLYNKNLQSFAVHNKQKMTKAEACLWKYVLKNKNMKGYAFRRQRPVFNYIADFMCIELKLIIEVDGLTHYSDEVAIKDDIRQKALQQAWFKVIRFYDDEVLKDIQNVVRSLTAVIEIIEENNNLLSKESK